MADRSRMRHVFAVALTLWAVPLWAQNDLIKVEDVRYVDNHDPGWIVLEADREVRVRWAVPGRLAFEDVNAWPKGKALSIALTASDGPVLVDPTTGRFIPILTIDKHPIDTLVGQCLEREMTTVGMVDCIRVGEERWEREMNREYRGLVQALSGQKRRAVERAQSAWLAYRVAQVAAIGAIDVEGTASQISRARACLELVKAQAERLAGLIEGSR